jgi:hypothetical protein
LDQLYPLIIDLKNLLLPIYKNVEFKNFQSTPEAQELCKTYESNHLMVASMPMDYEFKDEDFENPTLEKRDFEFYKKLENEDPKDWETVHITENATLRRSFQHYLHHVKFLELPIVLRSTSFFKANFQETCVAILHKLFENDCICVFFKVIDYQPNQFIVDQYVRRPPAEIRVRRIICTLKYENGTILGIMKPLKIPEMDFLKHQDLKFFINGEEHLERGVQEFYYVGFRISKVNDVQCKLETTCILDGRFGISGFPKSRANQKTMEFYKQFCSGLKKTKGKKIKDFKEEFNEMNDGLPANPFSKMLFDLKIDQYETPKDNQIVYNILNNIQIPKVENKNELKDNFLENISLSKVEFNSENDSKEIEKSILENILKSEEMKLLEGELLNSCNSESSFDLVKDESFSEIYEFENQNEFLERFDLDELNLVFEDKPKFDWMN